MKTNTKIRVIASEITSLDTDLQTVLLPFGKRVQLSSFMNDIMKLKTHCWRLSDKELKKLQGSKSAKWL